MLRGRLSRFARALSSDDVLVLAGSIAYAAVLSIFPLLIGLIALLSRIVDQAYVRDHVLSSIAPYLPERCDAGLHGAVG